MNAIDTCPVCGVSIEGDIVHFSHGRPGTRERLQARVCQFAKKPGCINISGIPSGSDFYGLLDNEAY
jgi:hypothetical protein